MTGVASRRLEPGEPGYPERLRELLGAEAAPALTVLGDAGLLQRPLTALFCSVRVPPELLLPAYDLARTLRDAGVAVIGGFQSPVERECLDFLLRGSQPVVVSPARGIEQMRLPVAWRAALAQGRLLVVSRFQATRRRPTAAMAMARNRLVAALAERILVVHAAPGGRLSRLVSEALAWRKPVTCFAHPQNLDVLLMGARPADPAQPLE